MALDMLRLTALAAVAAGYSLYIDPLSTTFLNSEEILDETDVLLLSSLVTGKAVGNSFFEKPIWPEAHKPYLIARCCRDEIQP